MPDRRAGLPIAAGCALAGVAVHILTSGSYGYFRDEMYYLACGDHLAWGYVDHAPLIALVARLTRTLLGDSLLAIRLLPALAAGCMILLAGLITRELGGGRFATFLACLSVLIAPVYLATDTLLTMNAFEPLFWMGCAWVLLLAINRDRPQLLVWLGVLAGVGLENKHSMLFFGAALVAGLLVSGERRLLLNRWMWIGAAIALSLFLPNLIWQARHGWPTMVDLRNARSKNVPLTTAEFLGRQVLVMLPPSILVWVAGLWFLLRDAAAKRYRALGWAFLVLMGTMIALHGKAYYMAPAYPMLFAAGGVFWERRATSRWVRVALPAVLVVVGLTTAPMALPLLPPDELVRYQQALRIQPPRDYVSEAGPLQEEFGDMFGWEEMVREVAAVYHALPPEERNHAAIFALNYGEAGAIDLFGPRYGLPKAICSNQTYFYWGPRQYTGDVMLVLGLNDAVLNAPYNRKRLEASFRSVEYGPRVEHPYSMTWEHYPIVIARGLKWPLAQLWPRLRFWN
jgi:hypothetical protein